MLLKKRKIGHEGVSAGAGAGAGAKPSLHKKAAR